jgi:hypothetical protein
MLVYHFEIGGGWGYDNILLISKQFLEPYADSSNGCFESRCYNMYESQLLLCPECKIDHLLRRLSGIGEGEVSTLLKPAFRLPIIDINA